MSRMSTGNPEIVTKRSLLSRINGIYDPMGLFSPFIIKAKVLMRTLWIGDCKNIGWDDPIPQDRVDEWVNTLKEINELESISFPRCLKTEECKEDHVLVIFSDSAESAYGTCAYARWKIENNKFATRLIIAKCRVTPLRATTMLRIELSGALMAGRIKNLIEKESWLKF